MAFWKRLRKRAKGERTTFKGRDRGRMRRSGPPLAYLESNDPAVLQTLQRKAAPASPTVALPGLPVQHTHSLCPRCKADSDRLTLQEKYIASLRAGVLRHEQDRAAALLELKKLDAHMVDFLAVEQLRRGVNEL